MVADLAPIAVVLPPGAKSAVVTGDDSAHGGLTALAAAANTRRNFGFGAIVGMVLAIGIYYAYVISPDEVLHSEAYYLALAVVFGLAVTVLVGLVLSVVTLVRAGDGHA